VNAVEDALRGGDGVAISGGVFDITAGNDGIKTNNTDSGKGNITLSGGTFSIKTGHDAVQAENNLTINSGVYTVVSGGGAAAAPSASSIGRNRPGNGDWGAQGWGRQPPSGAASTAISTGSESMKAFKTGKEFVINGGTFTIDAEDDAFHSNGNLTVKNGTFSIQTGDDGFHADNALRISGGSINILTSYEGLEGKAVEISGGNISLVSRDDGINASDGSAAAGPGRMGGSRTMNTDVYVRVNGGIVKVLSVGDGIDANGNLFIEGGEVYISGPSLGMQGAIDLDGSFVVKGGKLITAGSSLNPAAQSTQPVILVSYSAAKESGSLIAIKDRAGRTLLEYTARTNFTASAFSSPDFKSGETYGLYVNGRKLTDVTVRGTVTALADNGGTYSLRGGMGGGAGGRGRGF
jgi:hypothetical protein